MYCILTTSSETSYFDASPCLYIKNIESQRELFRIVTLNAVKAAISSVAVATLLRNGVIQAAKFRIAARREMNVV